MNSFDIFISIILVIKVIFILLAISTQYVKYNNPSHKKLITNLSYWKDRMEFVFIALMSVLLIYLFNPRVNRLNMITREAKILLYLFGFILIITAKWSIFFKESVAFKIFQKIIR